MTRMHGRQTRRRRLLSVLAAVLTSTALVVPTAGQADATPRSQACRTATLPAFVTQAGAVQLGCATSEPFPTPASEQPFEHGAMLWLQEWTTITVLGDDGAYTSHDDLYSPDQPESAGLSPPGSDLLEPRQGFGQIWRQLGGPASPLGWASAPEQSYVATVQYFEGGAVIQRADGGILALAIFNHARGQWTRSAAP